MIAILDPGIGNLHSVQHGLARAGADTVVIGDATAWERAARQGIRVDGVILPGVGAFGDAMFQLRHTGFIPIVRDTAEKGVPLLGICLGMQLLFDYSTEHGRHDGLGLLPGSVVRFGQGVKVPHMGWNNLDHVASNHPLLTGVSVGDYVYFVHSYVVQAERPEDVLASATYGDTVVPAVVGRGSVMGTQFHPEKSGDVGETILRNFVRLCTQSQTREVLA
ncbi:imidazole glycerol phosphate synthase subunit HisH [Alicyclobacillus acidiphilus]|uniref:imidazole glycerol phosphate synthase subunit HisH n=1 Tax=Alicyclobacillus acidiphilus TaxID=182455 RepID=UPI00082C65B8|nr:imidazole glycerol phosphate synthase subunit HisH [Alicyclobacillus acidiphilus]